MAVEAEQTDPMKGRVTGHIDFEVMPGTSLFDVRCVGMWSADQARTHFDRMEQMIHMLRVMKRPVHVLVDLRRAHIQSQETSRAMADGVGRVHVHADKVAFVGASALHALQVKRDVTAPQSAVFQSIDEARAWLAAE